MREIIALLAAPFLVRFFGRLAPIAVGGATTMDTTLPIITRYSGEKYIVVSIVPWVFTGFFRTIHCNVIVYHLTIIH